MASARRSRLSDATSPYLRQHADQPVDWWPWGSAAFERARTRGVPLFVSIGYAACHWCHVMAHESFEDDDVALALNEGFVPVKVDREERPDVDAVYMTATQALTGQGGWPMTVLATPDGDPFWCGTYLPREQLLGLLDAAGTAWRTRRDDVLAGGREIAGAVQARMSPAPPAQLDATARDAAAQLLLRRFDPVHAGFGSAPKFPPSMVMEFLLRHHARTGSPDSLRMVAETGEAMARGGMYDQLAGGFARYAVDRAWVVPHFEKMLYDNALLARVYAHWWRATGSELAARVADETCGFVLEALLTDEGGFAASLDADTAGVEGATYVWTPGQLAQVLGTADGARAAELLGVSDAGTFEHRASTLQLRDDPDDPRWWATTRAALAAARSTRSQPARDDKVVTSWNGLAIAALADVGLLLGRPALVAAAERAASFVLDRHVVDGVLRRASRDGTVGAPLGVADDYGNLAEGLLALHQATGARRWLDAAGALLDSAADRFGDGSGVFHDTAADGERLFARPHSSADAAEPSGQSALAAALVSYGALAGSAEHLDLAARALAVAAPTARRDPVFAGWSLAAAEALGAGPLQVAVVGSGLEADELARVAAMSTSPGLVHVRGVPDAPGVPLLADRPLADGAPAAYVCRGFVCDRPVATAEQLRAALG